MPQDSAASTKPAKESPSCDICCHGLPSNKIFRPCHCGTRYCAPCLKTRFVFALQNKSMMPPSCCKGVIPLHYALPMMSADEASRYRELFDEWYSPRKVYCPVLWCSAFIADRHLPPDIQPASEPGTGNQTQPVPSNSSAVQPSLVNCPKCRARICLGCKQLCHPGKPCEDSVEQETRNVINKLGYKNCPSCGTGVRRMFGCNHMHCPCGAHWCWGCRRPIGQCEEREECLQDEDDCVDLENEQDVERVRYLQQMIAAGKDKWPQHGATFRSWCKAILEHYLDHPNPDSYPEPVPAIRQRLRDIIQTLDLVTADIARDADTEIAQDGRKLLDVIGKLARTDAAHAETSNQDAMAHFTGTARDTLSEYASQDPTPEPELPVLVDLDRRDADAGLDLGDEPDEPTTFETRCPHSFTCYAAPDTKDEARVATEQMECHRCWRNVRIKSRASKRYYLRSDDTGPTAWSCGVCYIILCSACAAKSPTKVSDSS